MTQTQARLVGLVALALGASSACGQRRAEPASAAAEQRTPEWLTRTVSPLSEDETNPYRGCARDSDCIVATNGCCDCANGGVDIAIHRDQLGAFRARLDCSRNGSCTEVGAVVPCGSGSVRCAQARCEYVPPPAAATPH